jgi:hypothetical protein
VFSASSILISNCEPLKTENVLRRLSFIKIKRINVNQIFSNCDYNDYFNATLVNVIKFHARFVCQFLIQ